MNLHACLCVFQWCVRTINEYLRCNYDFVKQQCNQDIARVTTTLIYYSSLFLQINCTYGELILYILTQFDIGIFCSLPLNLASMGHFRRWRHCTKSALFLHCRRSPKTNDLPLKICLYQNMKCRRQLNWVEHTREDTKPKHRDEAMRFQHQQSTQFGHWNSDINVVSI
jgi:hypothetical protein